MVIHGNIEFMFLAWKYQKVITALLANEYGFISEFLDAAKARSRRLRGTW